MRRLNTLLLTLATAAIVLGQQPGTRHVVSIRYKVDQTKRAEYVEFVKNTSAKVMKEWLKTEPHLIAWASSEVQYAGSPMLDYNFSSTFTYDGPPPEGNTAAFQTALKNAGVPDYQTRARALRTLVGQQLRRNVATTDGPSGDYVAVSYYKAVPGRLADCLDSLRTISQPVYASMKNDGVVATWGAWEVVFPRGQSQPFDFLIGTSYKSLAEAVEANTAPFAARFPKVHPGKSYLGFADAFRATRTLVRTDLLHRIASVSRQ